MKTENRRESGSAITESPEKESPHKETRVVARRKEFLTFGSPLIEQQEIDEVVATLKSGWLGTGPRVSQFEELFREHKGARHAVALNSCTGALHLAMIALGIHAGDEVIVPTMTFAATANAVIHAEGRPVFVDCDRRTMNMDPLDVKRKITNRTRAIIPVHFAGRACDMNAIMEIARRYGLRVIEDCAHAIEATYHEKPVGTFGDLGCFSFYVTKNIVTGEGGMVVTDDEDLANQIKILALHGLSKDAWKRFNDSGYEHYQVVSAGFKCNMMDIQAAIGIHQLPRIDEYWKRREAIWNRYDQAFKDLPVQLPAPAESQSRHSYHLYTLLLKTEDLKFSRDQFLERMTERNIGVGVHYVGLHLHQYYQEELGYSRGEFPNAEYISDRTVSLPLSAKLTDEDASDVIRAVREIIQDGRGS